MSNDNIHYDYCRCCGGWVKKIMLLDLDLVCKGCFDKYGYDWWQYKKATAAPLSDEL